jgi:D-arabinose 1-dehydrogenase-like Zn-dependent alcohol dehydrogenase
MRWLADFPITLGTITTLSRTEALIAVPDSLKSADAAPLLCAGITAFNALRNTGAKPPDTVAILGMGGLGHLGVQFAAKMGFNTVAIARGADKEKFAHDLGARHYIAVRALMRVLHCKNSAAQE